MVALPALLSVLPPPAASSKEGESHASGAAADFAALELLRRLAFAKDVPPRHDVDFRGAGGQGQGIPAGHRHARV